MISTIKNFGEVRSFENWASIPSYQSNLYVWKHFFNKALKKTTFEYSLNKHTYFLIY